MRYSALTMGALALLPACATVNTYFESRADQRFEAGLAAFQRGDYVTANEEMGWVVERSGKEHLVQQALLAVSAIEMDPRNSQRRLALGADLASAYLRLKNSPPWLQPVAQTLYLLAVEMGATEDRVAQVEAQKQEAERQIREVERTLEPLSFPKHLSTVPARIGEVTKERDRLVRKVATLEEQLAERSKKLEETEKELSRIKRTLKG